MVIPDFIFDFDNPIIYRNGVLDNLDTTILTNSLTSLGLIYETQSPPLNPDFSNINAMLAGRDTIIIGGPISNTLAEGFQTNLQSSLPSGIINLSFTTTPP